MIMPERKTIGAAGYDLYVPEEVTIHKGRNLIKLGFALELSVHTYARIVPRSGFSLKGMCGVYDADVVEGTLDEDYRGEVGVIVSSREEKDFKIPQGTRIAQMIIGIYYAPKIEINKTLHSTDRGNGGFGSTGEGKEAAL